MSPSATDIQALTALDLTMGDGDDYVMVSTDMLDLDGSYTMRGDNGIDRLKMDGNNGSYAEVTIIGGKGDDIIVGGDGPELIRRR